MKFRFLLFFVLWQANTFAQPYYFKHFLTDDGLPHNTVSSLLQDSNGLIWVGTKSGLSSFNGYTFKAHTNRDHKFGTIGNNFILSLAEDKVGMIWVATGRGVFKYDPVYETFKEIKLTNIEAAFNLKIDRNNNVWWLKNDVLVKYHQQKKLVTFYPNIKANSFDFDEEGNIWLGTASGSIMKLNPTKNTITKIVQLIDKKQLPNSKVISKLVVNGDRVLAGTEKQGLISYQPLTDKKESWLANIHNKSDVYVRDILVAGKNSYWVATESGIYVCNFNTKSIVNLRKKADNRFAITDNAVYCLLKDNQSGFWAGTFFGGLNYHSPTSSKFIKYIVTQGENSISGNAVREIVSNDGKQIWIGTEDGGLNKLNTATGKFSNFSSNGKSTSISYPNIHGLAIANNQLYIGPFLHGLDVMDLNTELIVQKYPIVADTSGLGSDFVMSIFKTRSNRIFVGTVRGGLFEFIAKQRRFKKLKFIGTNASIFSISEDHTGKLWIGTLQNGIYAVDLKTGKYTNMRFYAKANEIDYQVQGIFEDSNNNLWISTEGGGLIKIAPNRRKIKKYTTENGLPSNYIYSVLEDESNNLWISSLKGLICLNPKNNELRIFTQGNGLLTDQFNYHSAYKAPNGTMYFGTVQGLISFLPSEVAQIVAAPPIAITSLEVNNKEIKAGSSILEKAITYIDTLNLAYNQANFSLEFAALNYESSKTIAYKYLMEGLENKSWTYLKTNQRVYFTDLAPGTYRFLVKGENKTSNWETVTKELVIQVSPPFWKSSIAYLIYLIIFLLLIYFVAYNYKRRIESKNSQKLQFFEFEKNKEIYQAKIEFFTNIAHEIQTPLTLIKGPVERLINKINEYPNAKKNLEVINKNTDKLLNLSSKLLDFRKTEIDQFGLNFVNIDIKNALKQELLLFKVETEKRQLKVELKMPKEKVEAFVDHEAFLKIVNNLLSNAVKYAHTFIKIQLLPVSTNDQNFNIQFTNDGEVMTSEQMAKIFEPFYRLKRNIEKPGTGIGLPIARSLAELHGGKLTVTKTVENLIAFELTLPIHHSIEFKLSNWKKL